MKNIPLMLFLFTILFQACKSDEDTDLPYIFLKGDNPYNIDSIGGTFTEPGYTAVDDVDGDITSSVIVDYPVIGTDSARNYDIIYSVTDKAGNKFTTTRKVNVRSRLFFLEGYYTSSRQQCDTIDSVFSAIVLPEANSNNTFLIRNFGNHGILPDIQASYDFTTGKININTPQTLADSSILDFVDPDSTYLTVTNDTASFQVFYTHTQNGNTQSCRTYYKK
jgi:hypothetical protein